MFQLTKNKHGKSAKCRPRLTGEALEQRNLFATLVVSTNLDAWPVAPAGSLREAVQISNSMPGPDTIVFDSALSGSTINLAGRPLRITDDLLIDGGGAAGLTIDAGGTPGACSGMGTRIFNVDDGTAANRNVTLSHLVLTGGDVAGHGGAIRAVENLTVVDSVVTGNCAAGSGAFHGGGIFWRTTGGSLVIERSIVSGNFATGDGGGIHAFVEDGNSLMNEVTVSDNFAGQRGGGVFLRQHLDGTSEIVKSSIFHNQSNTSGGGIFGRLTDAGNHLSVISSAVYENAAPDGGGLHLISNSLLTGPNDGVFVSNSTVSGNSADHSGGGAWVENYLGRIRFEYATVADNIADSDSVAGGIGGGVYATGPLSPEIDNSIIAQNVRTPGGPLDDVSGVVFADYSLIEAFGGVVMGANNIFGTNPLLGPLADNGGPTLTHALTLSSPALDAADPGFVAGPLWDQRGAPFNRVVGGQLDMGAYESFSPGDYDGDGDCDCADIDALVNEIVAGTHNSAYDLTGDGLVDHDDLDLWLVIAGEKNLGPGKSYLPGDANLDGVVDVSDFVVWNSHKFTASSGWCSGDFNADGVVDVSDFAIWNTYKFQSSDAIPTPPLQPGDSQLMELGVTTTRSVRNQGRLDVEPLVFQDVNLGNPLQSSVISAAVDPAPRQIRPAGRDWPGRLEFTDPVDPSEELGECYVLRDVALSRWPWCHGGDDSG